MVNNNQVEQSTIEEMLLLVECYHKDVEVIVQLLMKDLLEANVSRFVD
jgi:hypothetical protein